MMEKLAKAAEITILRFADDIDSLAEEEQEIEALVDCLDTTRYKNIDQC